MKSQHYRNGWYALKIRNEGCLSQGSDWRIVEK